IKDRFQVDDRQRVGRVGGAEIRITDLPWDQDAPEKSSIKYPSDLCLRKPATDVVVVGSAMMRSGDRFKVLDVLVRVGPVQKALRVFGARVWYKGLIGLSPGPSASVESVPVTWELAYGGSDFEDPKHPLEESRNPVGRGLVRDSSKLENKPAPQIEDPRALISGPRSCPAPAGVGAIGRHWMPRRQYTGTMDARW